MPMTYTAMSASRARVIAAMERTSSRQLRAVHTGAIASEQTQVAGLSEALQPGAPSVASTMERETLAPGRASRRSRARSTAAVVGVPEVTPSAS